MTEFFQDIVGVLVPVFVVSTMLNVGLTQRPSEIVAYMRHWRFILRMLIANFVLVPLFMVIALRLTSFDPALDAGLLIFALCAGAPFLIKLTQAAEHDLALGAAVMMFLMVLTVCYVPLALPVLLPGTSVDPWGVAKPLLLTMIAPLVLGMMAAQSLPGFSATVQPWVSRLANVALYGVIATTLVGYFRSMLEMGAGPVAVAVAAVAAAFGFGYLAGGGRDHLEDVGGLGTAQRNTAAGFIIATQNFDDPRVLVMLTVANTVGLVMLLFLARALRHDNPAAPLTRPEVAGSGEASAVGDHGTTRSP
jgi:BASS family bile acid:Na+ symporter